MIDMVEICRRCGQGPMMIEKDYDYQVVFSKISWAFTASNISQMSRHIPSIIPNNIIIIQCNRNLCNRMMIMQGSRRRQKQRFQSLDLI